MEVRIAAERERGERQYGNEQRHRKAMHDADRRQNDRDPIEVSG
jgi:hypothetical protein